MLKFDQSDEQGEDMAVPQPDSVSRAIELGAKKPVSLIARPAPGDNEKQFARAFEMVFIRYHRAFQELSKH